MSSASRRARHTYLGSRVRGSVYTGGKGSFGAKVVSRVKSGDATGFARNPVRLKMRIRPDGRWGYRFRCLRGLK